MGDFPGHFFPGLVLVLMGFFYIVKSLSVSFPMRYNKIWVSVEGWVKLLSGVVGFIAEALMTNGFLAMSQQQHMIFYLLFVVLGLIDLAHLHMVVLEPFWGFVSPLGFMFLGVMMTGHSEVTEIRTFYHIASGLAYIGVGLTRAVELFIALNSKSVDEALDQTELPRRWWAAWKKTYNSRGINRMYVNPNGYASIFPFLSGCLLIFNGQLWIDMAFTFFRDPHYIHPWELNHMAFHLGFTRIAAHLGFQLAALFVISFMAKKVDAVLIKRRGGFDHYKELEILTDSTHSSVMASSAE